MARYSAGKKAYFIDDRSGFKVKYKNARTEWTGSRVYKGDFESKHPQLTPSTKSGDNEALRNARPARSEPTTIFLGGPGFFDHNNTMQKQTKKPPVIVPTVGSVTVSIS